MTQNQFMGILRAVVPAILAYAVGKHWITGTVADEVTAAIVTLAAAGWSVATNKETPPPR
jgi:hypothetical protein